MTDKTVQDLRKDRKLAQHHMKVQQLLYTVMPYMIVLLMLGVIFLTTRLAATSYEVKETSAYTRVSNCIVAKVANPPTTQDAIERCYAQVEKQSGISLVRFDEQINNEKVEKR